MQMHRHARTLLLVVALATALLASRAVGSQDAPGRFLTLQDPADGVVQPQLEFPAAHIFFRIDDDAIAAAGGERGGSVNPTFTVDGQRLPWLSPNLSQIRVLLDPCTLPATDDLPGAQFTIEYSVTNTTFRDPDRLEAGEVVLASDTGRVSVSLGPDSKEPRLTIVSPLSGTRVKPGADVSIMLRAEEPEDAGVWQMGVNRFELLNPDGERREEIVSRGGPRACGDKVRTGEASFTYRVPRDAQPGRTLDFVAWAFDWANNSSRLPLTLVVEEDAWTGTVTSVGTAPGPHGPGSGLQAHDTVSGNFTFSVGADGMVTGRGRATFKAEPAQSMFSDGNICTTTVTQSPDTFDLVVRGRRDGAAFHLEIRGVGTATRMATTMCTRGGGSGTIASSLFSFAGVSGTGNEDAGVDVMIQAEDGALARKRLELPGGIQATAEVEIRRRVP